MLAKCPVCVYRTDPDGEYGATPDRKHPAYRILRHKANELQTSFHWKLAMAGHAINRGNGYSLILRKGPVPSEVALLDPDETEPVIERGELWYTTKIDQRKVAYPAADIIHWHGFGFDGIRGYPLWQMAKEAIALGLTREQFAGSRYKNGARPGVVLSTDTKLKDEARVRLRTEWERMHGGQDNIGRTAVLDNGLKASTLSFSPEEMQEVESSGLTIRDAANFLGIPSSKLGDVAGVKYASKEQDDREAIEGGVDFWMVSFESEAWDKLLLPSEQDAYSHLIEFDRSELMSFDLATLANYYRTALGGRGWMSPAEVREELRMEPRDDEGIDDVLIPMNMGQGGADNDPDDMSDPDAGRPTEEEGGGEEDGAQAAARGAAETALLHAARKMVKRVAFHAKCAAVNGAAFVEFVGWIRSEHESVFLLEFAPAEQTARLANNEDKPRPGEAAGWLLSSLHREFDALASKASIKTLAASVAALTADQEVRLPKQLVVTFLG